jgi:hypothetical protein
MQFVMSYKGKYSSYDMIGEGEYIDFTPERLDLNELSQFLRDLNAKCIYINNSLCVNV